MSGTAEIYHLGIDLGTTYTAAAVARDGHVRTVSLGDRAAAIPSVLHVAPDGTVLVGDAAERRAPTEPDRVAREFKRRIGDPTPLLLGAAPYSAEILTARLLRSVIDKVSELEGGPPTSIAVTHPANWGPYKQDLFTHSVELAGVSALLLTEPEAAAIAYAANARVEPGSLVAVYDLGGGTFDVAVLRKNTSEFSILGRPDGIERLGGIDFDEAVVGHVRNALGGAIDQVELEDPAAMAALVRLRRECIEAKEALSTDTGTTIPVLLPGVQTDVRLTRGEFEQMVRPTLAATVDAMQRALVSASVDPSEITAVLLVGGSSRIPLVAELVSDAFGRPVAVDADPKHAVALGAAHAAMLDAEAVAAPDLDDATVPPAAVGVAPGAVDPGSTTDLDVPLSGLIAAGQGRHAVHHAEAVDRAESVEELPPFVFGDQRRWSRKSLVQAAAVVVLALIGVGAGAFYSTEGREGKSRVGAGAAELVIGEPWGRFWFDDRDDQAEESEDDARPGDDSAVQKDSPDTVGSDAQAVTPATKQSGSGRTSGSSGGSSDPRNPPSSGSGGPANPGGGDTVDPDGGGSTNPDPGGDGSTDPDPGDGTSDPGPSEPAPGDGTVDPPPEPPQDPPPPATDATGEAAPVPVTGA